MKLHDSMSFCGNNFCEILLQLANKKMNDVPTFPPDSQIVACIITFLYEKL